MLKQLDHRPDGNFVPVQTLRRDLDTLAKAFHLQVHKEKDDLGSIRCAYLETTRKSKFVLFAYAHRAAPKGFVEVGILSGLKDPDTIVKDVHKELRVDKSDVLPRDVRYREIA